MRTRYVWRDGEMIEIAVATPGAEPKIQIVPDIGGYKSMADGSWISSRSQHREHLKQKKHHQGDADPTQQGTETTGRRESHAVDRNRW